MPNEKRDFPQAPLCRDLSGGADDRMGAGGGGADRSSLERLWGDELYEEDEEDIEENDIGGDINSREQSGGGGYDDGEVLRSIRKECSNLTLRIESADEEVKPRESIGRNQI